MEHGQLRKMQRATACSRIKGRRPTYYKNTTLMVSSTLLLEPFRALQCTCREHGTLQGYLEGIPKTRFAQVWPRSMCLQLCTEILAFIRSQRRNHLVYGSVPRLCPVAIGSSKRRGRPRKNPDGIEDTRLGVICDCPACVGGKHQHHPDDTRNGEPPQLWRHYNEEPGD